MSWTRLDDGLPESAKWASISEGAFCLAIRSLCWARKTAQLKKRPGFIPANMLVALSRRGKGASKKLADELVSAGHPLHDHGIWLPVEEGWMIHDFEQYGHTGPGAVEPHAGGGEGSSRSEAARVAGKASAASRLASKGSSQPNRSNGAPNVAERTVRTEPRTSPNEPFERSPNVLGSSSQDLSQDPQNPGSKSTKEKPASLKTSQVIAREPADTGGLLELGANERQERVRPRFGALLAPVLLTARELQVPPSIEAYAAEHGLDQNAISDIITDWRAKITDRQSADRLVSVLFRFIEAKTHGKPKALVPPAVKSERDRASAKRIEVDKANERRAIEELNARARENLIARGLDPDATHDLDLKSLVRAIG